MERKEETIVKIRDNTTIIADKKNKSVDVWAINGAKILPCDIDVALSFAFEEV